MADINLDDTKYYWQDLNDALDFSQSFVTTYKNYLVIDGQSLSSIERCEFLPPNTQISVALTVVSESNTIENGTGTLLLEVNDVPSNGTCKLYVGENEYVDEHETSIYALKNQVTINCRQTVANIAKQKTKNKKNQTSTS